MKRGIRKSDVVLFIAIMACAAIFYFFLSNNQAEPNARLIVKVDGEVIKTCSLEEDQVFWLPGKTNEVSIQNGEVSMKEADCPDQICVRQKAISKEGESIICLPNKVVVSIVGGEEKELDAVTN